MSRSFIFLTPPPFKFNVNLLYYSHMSFYLRFIRGEKNCFSRRIYTFFTRSPRK